MNDDTMGVDDRVARLEVELHESRAEAAALRDRLEQLERQRAHLEKAIAEDLRAAAREGAEDSRKELIALKRSSSYRWGRRMHHLMHPMKTAKMLRARTRR